MAEDRKFTISLAWSVALLSTLVTVVSMFVYGVVQYITDHDATFTSLFVRHGWHAVALGALNYLVVYIVLYDGVLLPARSIYGKLYGISRGDTEPIQFKSRIKEVQTIIDGTNMLVAADRSNPRITRDELNDLSMKLRSVLDEQGARLSESNRTQLERIAVKLENRAGRSEG